MTDNVSPKITIIVPVYNVERYLRRCLDSIAAQTFTDWECILIDDGSPDASGAICDEYVANDGRFRVIHQENRGVSVARNAGLDAARGEWIVFVDSDDWIENTMLEIMSGEAKRQNSDVVISGHIYQNEKAYGTNGPKDGILHMPKDFSEYLNASWAKLIKRSVLSKNNIRFPLNIKIAEDLFFLFQIFLLQPKIFGISKPMYNYFQNPDSVIHTITSKEISDEKKVIEMIENVLIEKNCHDEWDRWLIEKKIICKNKYLFSLKKPSVFLWKNTFPELTNLAMQKSSEISYGMLYEIKRKMYFLFAKLGLSFVVVALSYIHKPRICRGHKFDS